MELCHSRAEDSSIRTIIGVATPSYVHSTSTTPLLGATIGQAFDATAARWPANAALIVPHQSVRWTYGELRREVDAQAAGLLSIPRTRAVLHITVRRINAC